MKFDNRKFILLVRSISGIVLALFAIDIIFFNHRYISIIPIGNGVTVGIAGILVQYGVDYTKKSLKQRLLLTLLFLIVISILYYFWYK